MGGGGSYGRVLMQPASSRACSRTRYHSARYYLQGPLKKCPCSYMEVSLNYCSQNGGNLYRAPYYNRNLNIGPRIDSRLGQSPHRVEGLGFRVQGLEFLLVCSHCGSYYDPKSSPPPKINNSHLPQHYCMFSLGKGI